MKKIAFLGAGKIGQSLAAHVLETKIAEPVFFYAPSKQQDSLLGIPIIRELNEDALSPLDLVVECASSQVVSEYAVRVLKTCDFMTFSMTAFADDELYAKAKETAREHGTTLYLPHGAILGLDGIFDGREAFDEISIETIKSPKSLGRDDAEKTVVYEGTARGAAAAYPRNVNVHAAVALAGLGFDRTKSKITSDPSVNTNEHVISIKGTGIDFTIHVKSFAAGAVSGKYVPYSACGSLDRILAGKGIAFV